MHQLPGPLPLLGGKGGPQGVIPEGGAELHLPDVDDSRA
jgi:hypothetical protein